MCISVNSLHENAVIYLVFAYEINKTCQFSFALHTRFTSKDEGIYTEEKKMDKQFKAKFDDLCGNVNAMDSMEWNQEASY